MFPAIIGECILSDFSSLQFVDTSCGRLPKMAPSDISLWMFMHLFNNLSLSGSGTCDLLLTGIIQQSCEI